MQETSNQIKIYLARVIFEGGRAEDAAKIIRPLVQSKFHFEGEDRELLMNIWNHVINPIRLAIMNIQDVAPHHGELAIQKLNEPLLNYLDEIINLLNSDIIPATAGDDEGKARYGKYLADFLRYKCDCVPRDQKESIASLSKKNYEKSLELYRSLPGNHTELILQIQINYSILLADHMGQTQKAIDILSKEHHDASVSLGKYPEDIKIKIQELINLMAENLKRLQSHFLF